MEWSLLTLAGCFVSLACSLHAGAYVCSHVCRHVCRHVWRHALGMCCAPLESSRRVGSTKYRLAYTRCTGRPGKLMRIPKNHFFCFIRILFVRMWAARVPKLPDLQVQRGELSEAAPGRWSSGSRCRMPESERRTGLRIRRRRGGFRWTSQPRLEPCRRRPDAITEFERMRFCAGSSRTLRREIGRDEQDPIGCGER